MGIIQQSFNQSLTAATFVTQQAFGDELKKWRQEQKELEEARLDYRAKAQVAKDLSEPTKTEDIDIAQESQMRAMAAAGKVAKMTGDSSDWKRYKEEYEGAVAYAEGLNDMTLQQKLDQRKIGVELGYREVGARKIWQQE